MEPIPHIDPPITLDEASRVRQRPLARARAREATRSVAQHSARSPETLAVPAPAPRVEHAALAQRLMDCARIVVVTGAGISESAGIPTFRHDKGNRFAALAREHGFKGKPAQVFSYATLCGPNRQALLSLVAKLRERCLDATPTAFHDFLSDLAQAGKLLRVYTQNIDGLESRTENLSAYNDPFARGKRAADCNVIRLHGCLHTATCTVCNTPAEADAKECYLCMARRRGRARRGGRATGALGHMRPSIVLYNDVSELLDSECIASAQQHDLAQAPDALLVVGTSALIPGVGGVIRAFGEQVRSRNGMVVWVNAQTGPPPAMRSVEWTHTVTMSADSLAEACTAELRK